MVVTVQSIFSVALVVLVLSQVRALQLSPIKQSKPLLKASRIKAPFAIQVTAADPKTTQANDGGGATTTTTKTGAGKTQSVLPPRRAKTHKRWGVDNTCREDEYWFDQRIHSLGNIGIGGGLHASIAPFATKRIDDLAYDGVDLRLVVAQELSKMVKTQKARVLDMCCGVGMSTRALCKAFPDAQEIMGLDTSPQMVAMAEFVTNYAKTLVPWFQRFRAGIERIYAGSCKSGQEWWKEQQLKRKLEYGGDHGSLFDVPNFIKANAQDTKLPSKSFDLITIMYAFHEAPLQGRSSIMEEARRLLSPNGLLAIVDIATDYTPSKHMLAGEPYVLEYQQNIHNQLKSMKGFLLQEYKTLVPGHVGMWTLRRQGV
ncbi:hypothetical protein ACA910_015010 [Epithemia clementina (nom. ined.)]